MKKYITTSIVGIAFILLLSGLTAAPPASAQLKPPLPNLDGIVKDKNWALVLGKALFFDQQVGSDGQACYSCHFHAGADTRLKNQLTPGFTDITYGPDGDEAFGSIQSDTGQVPLGDMPSGALAGPNYTLKPKDFPGHQLVDERDKDSPIRTTTNDRISSQGSFDGTFGRVSRLRFRDWCQKPDGDIFHAGPYPARLVEPRHTPTTINAAFNHRNFWDGRANNLFNGVGVFGMRDIYGDPKNRLIILDASGKPQLGFLQLENASLASQAVGPPLSEREMSCDGRTFPDVGRKMLLRIPLALQNIHAQDSVFGKTGPFGDLRSRFGRGLNPKYLYSELIKKAFEDKYWKAPGRYEIADDGTLKKAPLTGFTQMEHNFSMFWGISVMLYEATLVSDKSEFDTLVVPAGGLVAAPVAGCFPAGPPGTPIPPGVDPLWLRGCNIFFQAAFITGPFFDGTRPVKGAGCAFCHSGPVFSENAFTAGGTFTPFLNPVTDINGVFDLRDLGFANIGLRPVFSDPMVGGEDPYGNPLSFGRQYKQYLDSAIPVVDPYLQQAIAAGNVPEYLPPFGQGAPPPQPSKWGKLEADGATKIPTMRNIGLTPPYFSWGFYGNLRQVLKVYNRGMNPRNITDPSDPDAHGSLCSSGDSSGSGPDGNSPWPVTGPDCNTNTTGLIVPLGLLDCDANGVANPDCTTFEKNVTNDDLAALERFLKSLTDRRVQCDQAPFDHPSFFVFNGHRETDKDRNGLADDIIFELPAVGVGGYDPKSGYCIPNAGDLFAPGMQSKSGGKRVPLTE